MHAAVPPSAAAQLAGALAATQEPGDAPLAPHETAFAAEASSRYLAAAGGNAAQALIALRATLAWRRAAVPPPPALPRCAACARDPESHCIVCVGLLDDGRPVVYLSPPRARDLGTVSCTAHLTSELEAAFALPGAAPAAVWLVDLRGFSLLQSGMNPALGVVYARLLSAHYPERLSQLVLATPPGYFSLFISAIMPFLDKRTASKIVTLSSAADVDEWLGKHAAGAPSVPRGAGEGEAAGGGDAARAGAPSPAADAGGPPPRSVGEWLRQAVQLPPLPGSLPLCLPPGAPVPVSLR
jgi:hypothetical protein